MQAAPVVFNRGSFFVEKHAESFSPRLQETQAIHLISLNLCFLLCKTGTTVLCLLPTPPMIQGGSVGNRALV